jgi:hypothetical protein
MYQLGEGLYLRSTPIWVHNIENSTYSVPLGLGIGKVIRSDKVVYNLFVERQFSVAEKGAGCPYWRIFIGFNMQFKRQLNDRYVRVAFSSAIAHGSFTSGGSGR